MRAAAFHDSTKDADVLVHGYNTCKERMLTVSLGCKPTLVYI